VQKVLRTTFRADVVALAPRRSVLDDDRSHVHDRGRPSRDRDALPIPERRPARVSRSRESIADRWKSMDPNDRRGTSLAVIVQRERRRRVAYRENPCVAVLVAFGAPAPSGARRNFLSLEANGANARSTSIELPRVASRSPCRGVHSASRSTTSVSPASVRRSRLRNGPSSPKRHSTRTSPTGTGSSDSSVELSLRSTNACPTLVTKTR
jgi:hypothetical protein